MPRWPRPSSEGRSDLSASNITHSVGDIRESKAPAEPGWPKGSPEASLFQENSALFQVGEVLRKPLNFGFVLCRRARKNNILSSLLSGSYGQSLIGFDLQLPTLLISRRHGSLHWPLATGHSPLPTRNPPPTDPPKSGSFACPIPPRFVLSCNLPTTNTRAIWLRSGAFLSPPAPSLQIHWPLATILSPLATRPTSHATRAAVRQTSGVRSWADPPPLATACHRPPNCQGVVRDRSRRAAPLSHYSPNQAIPADKSIRSSPLAAAHPLTVLSWPEPLDASGFRCACRMAISRNACPLVATNRENYQQQDSRSRITYGIPGTRSPPSTSPLGRPTSSANADSSGKTSVPCLGSHGGLCYILGREYTTPVNGYQSRLKRSTCSSAKSPTLLASAPSGTKSSFKVSALLSRPVRLFLAVPRSLLA